MRVLVDTSVWIDFLHGVEASHVEAFELAIISHQILMPDIALAEILLGLRTDQIARKVDHQLRQFDVVDIGGRNLAINAAQNYRVMRANGTTIRSTIDLLIGTWCIEENIPLLHNERDYEFMEQHLGMKSAIAELLS